MKKADRDDEPLGYRPAVGIMLLNSRGEVFVARRRDMPTMPAWQMPQGGIDPGETPRQAALRELEEEICTAKAEIVGESRVWLHYDLTVGLAGAPLRDSLPKRAPPREPRQMCHRRPSYRPGR